MFKYSIIVPVYNRPDEIDELLGSLSKQSFRDFEVIIVEDGSDIDCKRIIGSYQSELNLHYHLISNSGPGLARNHGASKAKGEWLIFLDSDTLIPEKYLVSIEDFIDSNNIDAFGGADRDKDDFLPIQRAISYSMTSFFTTGGIRGSRKSVEKFKPRSFNMGMKKSVFEALEGFSKMRYGEDIDFSIRIERGNYTTAFIPEAFVYHKRRTSFKAFFHQIRHSGEARIALKNIHRGSLKLVHLFPALFTLGMLISVILVLSIPLLGLVGLGAYAFYFLTILIDASSKSRSLKVGLLSVISSFVQLSAYGIGFIRAGLTNHNK